MHGALGWQGGCGYKTLHPNDKALKRLICSGTSDLARTTCCVEILPCSRTFLIFYIVLPERSDPCPTITTKTQGNTSLNAPHVACVHQSHRGLTLSKASSKASPHKARPTHVVLLKSSTLGRVGTVSGWW
ncbi:unnamed protein product [Ectocarpus sp. 8 AP-2014]